MGTEAVRLRL